MCTGGKRFSPTAQWKSFLSSLVKTSLLPTCSQILGHRYSLREVVMSQTFSVLWVLTYNNSDRSMQNNRCSSHLYPKGCLFLKGVGGNVQQKLRKPTELARYTFWYQFTGKWESMLVWSCISHVCQLSHSEASSTPYLALPYCPDSRGQKLWRNPGGLPKSPDRYTYVPPWQAVFPDTHSSLTALWKQKK